MEILLRIVGGIFKLYVKNIQNEIKSKISYYINIILTGKLINLSPNLYLDSLLWYNSIIRLIKRLRWILFYIDKLYK